MSKFVSLPLQSKKEQNNIFALLQKKGCCFVYPTETSYALGCFANDNIAIERIYSLKQRSQALPLLVLVSSFSMFLDYTYPLLKSQEQWLFNNWPSALTVVTLSRNKLASSLHKNSALLGFRFTTNINAISLITMAHCPLVGTSANIHKQPPALSCHEAYAMFGDQVDLYFDAGTLAPSLPSTVLHISAGSGPTILREGEYKCDLSSLV